MHRTKLPLKQTRIRDEEEKIKLFESAVAALSFASKHLESRLP